jgi:hypothetical protein
VQQIIRTAAKLLPNEKIAVLRRSNSKITGAGMGVARYFSPPPLWQEREKRCLSENLACSAIVAFWLLWF